MTSDFGCIPQFDGGDDLIDLDAPPTTTTTPLAPGGTSVLTGIVYLYSSVCFWVFYDLVLVLVPCSFLTFCFLISDFWLSVFKTFTHGALGVFV